MKQKKLKRKIVKDSVLSFASSIINRIGTLFFTIILARMLMPSDYGVYSLVYSTAMIFYTFADLGINQALVRYTSYYLSRNKMKAPAYYNYLFKVKLVLTFVVSFLLLFSSYPIAIHLFKNKEMFLPLAISAFYIFILSFENFYSGLFYSLNKIKFLTFKEFFNQTLRIIFSLLILFFVVLSYKILGIFLALIAVSTLMFLFAFFYTKKICPELFVKNEEKVDKKRVLSFVGFLTIASISGVFFSYIDAIMLGIFLKPEYVGYYRAAFSLVFGVIGLVSFPSAILLPWFTRLKKIEIEKVFNYSLKYSSIIAIPASFGLIVLGRYFLKFFYGDSYLLAALPLLFLAFLIFPIIAVTLFLSLFSAEEKPQIPAKLIFFSSILNIVLNYVLIKSFLLISPLWATAGAALSTLISWLFYLLASAYYVKKEVCIKSNFKIIKPIIASLFMAGIIFLLTAFFKDISLISGIIEVFVGIFAYFLVLYILKGITREDFNLFLSFIKRK